METTTKIRKYSSGGNFGGGHSNLQQIDEIPVKDL